MDTLLFQALKNFANQNYISFQMPGHKGKFADASMKKLFPAMDVTETFGTDNLYQPSAMIQDSLDQIAQRYGARQSFFLVNGSTGGILTAVAAVCQAGDTILLQRNAHISAYHACVIRRLQVKYLYPVFSRQQQIPMGINPADLATTLRENPQVKAVLLVHPNYYGIGLELDELVRIAHKHQCVVILDEAHGAHFPFHSRFPASGLAAGADIVIQSVHKTMPSLTQTALLHLQGDRLDPSYFKLIYRLFQTTSPSYLFMASIEKAIAYMDSDAGQTKIDEMLRQISRFQEFVQSLPGTYTLSQEAPFAGPRDPSRLVFGFTHCTGAQLMERLHHSYRINMEMADTNYCVGICTVGNQKTDYRRLRQALTSISRQSQPVSKHLFQYEVGKSQQILPLWLAFEKKKRRMPFQKAIGQISGQFLIPYPPGIPMLVPGEKITLEIFQQAMAVQQQSGNVMDWGADRSTNIQVCEGEGLS